MNYQNLIDFLLENANPSIRLRVKKEILGNITAEEEAELIAQIKEEPTYKLIANCQKENGWLGNGFHGPNKDAGPYENQEVGTKWLAEKALGKDDPVLKRAMDAFVTTELTDLCYRTKGKYFDEFRYAANGQNLIRCACIARAGYDDIIDIRPQIQLALDSFKRVIEVDSILDITRIKKVSGKEKRVFNDYEKWPCYYHLDKVLDLRKRSGLSQEELAEKLEVSRQAISRWEMGLAMPDASNLLQLSKLFKVTTDYLINDEYSSDEDIPIVKNKEDSLNKEMKKVPAMIKSTLIGMAVAVLLAILFFPFVAELPILIIPIVVLPFPTFYFSVFYKELKSLKLILSTSTVLLLVVNVITVVGFWISYNVHHGEAYAYLILWDNIICFINAAALLSFGSFVAFTAVPKKWWVNLLIYMLASTFWIGVACIFYSITSDNSLSHNINMMEKMLPGICSPRALENNNFKQAYLLDEKIFNCIINQNYDLSDEDMEKCFEYYFAAIDEKVIEASANLLRQIFLVGMITCWMNPKFMDAFDGIKESPKKLVQAMYLTSYDDEADSEWLQQREEFLEEYELHIVLNIYRLKHSAEYADLGDFYMALRYIFGMVRNGNSPELNSAIGYQMMSEFSMLGNIYADKFSTK